MKLMDLPTLLSLALGFTATYKYALLIAIADYAVQYGQDNNEELKIPTRRIGCLGKRFPKRCLLPTWSIFPRSLARPSQKTL